ncbi:MAG: type II secretion system F family protein [Methylophilaceae bacterium]|nr:type II secretion system F family protein [Methylophilaceae bacterium]
MKYKWKGLDKNNFAEGEIEAEDEEVAIYLLRKEGVTVTSIDTLEKEKKKKKERKSSSAKITDKELLLFTRKMATMMKAGLAIVPALEMLKVQNENPSFAPIIEELLLQINAGVPLSQCLERHPNLFDVVYVNLIKAGEASGNLDTFLDRITYALEKSIKIKKAIKSAMMYPIILLIVAFSVVGVMMIFVVPVFVEIFADAGLELPFATRIVMNISDFLRSPYAVAFGIGAIVTFKVLKGILTSNDALMMKFDKYIMTVPVLGKLVSDSIMARMAMILANLIAGGVNLVEALEIVKNSISNLKIQTSLEKVKREIYSGRPFSKSLRETGDFPETMCGFIEVGEETGKLNEMLGTVALYYEEEFDDSVDAFSQLLEPIMIVFLGVIIGFILVAMYTPIFEMGTTI